MTAARFGASARLLEGNEQGSIHVVYLDGSDNAVTLAKIILRYWLTWGPDFSCPAPAWH
jgi:hypothetical protein